MFVKGMCISMLWSFQSQCRVNTLMFEATSVSLILNIFKKKSSCRRE